MANPFKKLFRARDEPIERHPRNAVSQAMAFFFGSSSAGKNVTPRTSVQVSAVYACVRVLAETVASLPLHLDRYMEGSGTEHARNNPLYYLLHDEPNSEMTSYVWRETGMTHLALWGNWYNQKVFNGRGEVIGLYPLLPENVQVNRDETGQIVYDYTNSDGTFRLYRDEVLHVPGMGFDGLVGYSPVAMMRNSLGLSIAAEEYGARFYANGARPSGVLTHPGTLKEPAKVRDQWQKVYGGSSNTGKVAVLEEGLEYKPISMPNNEAQFLETRKFQVEEICRIYRVPPHMIADLEHATYSNIEHQSISFAQYTIAPWCARIEQSMNRDLLKKADKAKYTTHFNIDGIQRGSYQSRMEGYAKAIQNGWMSPNDVRALENLSLLTDEQGGNTYAINGNMVSLKSLNMQSQVEPPVQEDKNENSQL